MDMIDKIEAILKRELETPCKWCDMAEDDKSCIVPSSCFMDFRGEMFHEVAVMITQEVLEDW